MRYVGPPAFAKLDDVIGQALNERRNGICASIAVPTRCPVPGAEMAYSIPRGHIGNTVRVESDSLPVT